MTRFLIAFGFCWLIAYPLMAEGPAKIQKVASGDITLSDALVKDAQKIKTLFIVIYDMDSPRPMPFAATKVDLKQPPKKSFHKFDLDTTSIRQMRPGPLPKNMRIKARLDVDGSAGMDQAGDITGEVTSIKPGAKGVKILLDKKK
ncbi:MAG: hypothetical protein HRU19_01750 [Pseudobacteriovorax sp.]|nr:hypothetical protein [Pseudobacteriovorax sp.]